MTPERQLRLMLVHDGELEVAPRGGAVRLGLEERTVLRRFRELGDLVRETASARCEPPAGTADRILDHVRESTARHSPRSVSRGVAPRPRLQRVGGAPTLAGAFGLLALAAAVAFGVRTRPFEPSAHAPSASAPENAVAFARAVEPAIAIESVEFGAQGGAIFVVDSESGATPVVWTLEHPGIGASIPPL